MRHLPTLAAAVLLLSALLVGASMVPRAQFDVQQGSSFWIEGTSTLNSYTCEADRVAGAGTVSGSTVAAEVTVSVRSIDCGVRAMNRDLYRALRAEDHPNIRFTLRGADVLDASADPNAWVPVQAYGTLELAGVRRSVTLRAEGLQLPDGTVRVRGAHPLRMTHFEVEPPSGMLGLVRAHDQVVARFDLIAAHSGSR